MSPTERDRDELRQALGDSIGQEAAERLMEHTPPFPWDEIARQQDLLALRGDLDDVRRDVDVLKADVGVLKADVGVLKTDVGVLKTDVGVLKTDVGVLKTDVGVLKTDVGVLKTDLRILNETLDLRFDSLRDGLTGMFHKELREHARVMYFSMIGAVFTSASLAFAAVRI